MRTGNPSAPSRAPLHEPLHEPLHAPVHVPLHVPLHAPLHQPAARPMKSPKAASAGECRTLEQLPNIGPSLAADLRLIGVQAPADLRDLDAFVLYQRLCAATGARQDPCVLDTFMAATDFMRGAPAAPWWHYTAQRKALFGSL